MARWQKLLDKMRNNPQGDWTIDDIQTVAGHIDGMTVTPPSGGSHYGVAHPDRNETLTIPAKRPIKPIYVRNFVSMIDSIT